MSLPDEHSQALNAPAVSVIVPAYRCASHITKTLESVFAQTFKDFDVIVVNDGCPETEKLEQALHQYEARIKYVKHDNAGAAIARNRGVRETAGDLIAFLDGDDVWKPDYLEEQVRFLRSGGYDMVYCDADLVTDEAPLGRTFMHQAPSQGDVTVRSLLDLRCHVITSGTLLKRSAFVAAGCFENGRVLSEDFHLWVRVARSGARIGYHERVLLEYRVSDQGLSGDEVNRVERAIDVFRRIRREVPLSDSEASILENRLKEFEVDLAIARGKSHLSGGENRAAAKQFARAASHRPRPRIAAAAVLSVLAPSLLRRGMEASHERARRAKASAEKD